MNHFFLQMIINTRITSSLPHSLEPRQLVQSKDIKGGRHHPKPPHCPLPLGPEEHLCGICSLTIVKHSVPALQARHQTQRCENQHLPLNFLMGRPQAEQTCTIRAACSGVSRTSLCTNTGPPTVPAPSSSMLGTQPSSAWSLTAMRGEVRALIVVLGQQPPSQHQQNKGGVPDSLFHF